MAWTVAGPPMSGLYAAVCGLRCRSVGRRRVWYGGLSVADLLEAARHVLREHFAYSDFRPGQREAITGFLQGRDTVVLLPTGAGKSLCYQVPARLMAERGLGTTLVVSPLIALMQDQVGALVGRGLRAAALHSQLDASARKEAVRAFVAGRLDLLYVSPERAIQDSFKRMLKRGRIASLAIDEAHCVSEWGHDFRPEYLRLHELGGIVDVPTIALTATATPQILDEVVVHLNLQDPAFVCGDFRRPNLAFFVCPLSRDAERLEALVGALDAYGLRARTGQGRAVVYCGARKKTESVAKALRAQGFSAGHYHAGRTPLARTRVQRAFESGKKRTLVATNAFGMGVDYPDIRLVVHFQVPGSLAAYYQEAGRAGRDGRPARALMFFGAADLVMQRRLCAGSGRSERHVSEALRALERYARGTRCRQRMLSAHFGGQADSDPCGICDVCQDPEAAFAQWAKASSRRPKTASAPEALPPHARDCIVAAVGNLRRPVGKSKLAKALRGSRAKGLKRGALLTLPEHGRLRQFSEAAIVQEIERLLEAGTLRRAGQKYPTVWLPGRPIRSPRTTSESDLHVARPRPRVSAVARALENYRKRTARALRWKPYMVFQRRVITAIERRPPSTRDELLAIPGLGLAKVERFGDDILALVERHQEV